MKRTKNSGKVLAEICLYGTSATGAGWLATPTLPGTRQLLGNGEPKAGRSFTEAVWQAVEALKGAGVTDGLVAIFAPGGDRTAYSPIGNVPAFGDLTWEVAPVFTLDVSTVGA